MKMRGSQAGVLAAAALVMLIAAPARAQFDRAFNHLKCYKIKGPAVTAAVQLDNQFGTELVARLSPLFLCTPTKKTCCDPASPTSCAPVPCPPDPTPFQPAPVDHFKCYKIKAKTCSDPTCAQLAKFPKGTIVNLTDQFGVQPNVTVGVPQVFCAPVLKERVRPTTTTIQTTTTTTTTTMAPFCHFDPATFTCGGSCPPGTFCGVMNADPGQCRCYPSDLQCHPPGGPGTCNNGACPGPNPFQVCNINPATNGCECYTPCGANPLSCSGSCPPTAGSGIPRVCSGAPQSCICCIASGGPCFGNGDCCSNVCNIPPGSCQ